MQSFHHASLQCPHVCDIGIDKVFSTLLSVKARYLLFENANPRHAHEWRVFQERKQEVSEVHLNTERASGSTIVSKIRGRSPLC